MSEQFHVYGGIQKFDPADDGSLLVSGIASTECVDADGEVITADAMRKALPSYLQSGTVREMHQPIAAGKPVSAFVDDDGKTHFTAKIVDRSTIDKIKAGVLKGFSVGGKAIKRAGKTITELLLKDISVVDLPNNPQCQFTVIKFDAPEDECSDPQCEHHKEGAVRKCKSCVEKISKAKKKKDDGDPDDDRSEEDIHKDFDTESDHKAKYGDVDYADEELHKYPIDTKAHVRAAWSYINMPKNQHGASAHRISHIKSKIRAAAERLGVKISDEHETEKSMKKMLCALAGVPETTSDDDLVKALGARMLPADMKPDDIRKAITDTGRLATDATKALEASQRQTIIAKMDTEGRVPMNPTTGKAYTLDELNKMELPLLNFAAVNAPRIPTEARAIYKGTNTPKVGEGLKGSDKTQAVLEAEFPSYEVMKAQFLGTRN